MAAVRFVIGLALTIAALTLVIVVALLMGLIFIYFFEKF